MLSWCSRAASDTGKDTAKILGTAAAGAIIGHQVNHKNGSVVGGILGGAAGTAVAANTGGEVSLPAGTRRQRRARQLVPGGRRLTREGCAGRGAQAASADGS